MNAALPAHGPRLWFAVVGGIVAWLVHLTFLASFARFTCTEHGTTWVQHAVTAATALITVMAMALAWGYARAGAGADLEADSHLGHLRFFGLFGLLVGATNLALILLEGSYVVFISPCLR